MEHLLQLFHETIVVLLADGPSPVHHSHHPAHIRGQRGLVMLAMMAGAQDHITVQVPTPLYNNPPLFYGQKRRIYFCEEKSIFFFNIKLVALYHK